MTWIVACFAEASDVANCCEGDAGHLQRALSPIRMSTTSRCKLSMYGYVFGSVLAIALLRPLEDSAEPAVVNKLFFNDLDYVENYSFYCNKISDDNRQMKHVANVM